jgi:GNAT superfamily N-acetyltransferase
MMKSSLSKPSIFVTDVIDQRIVDVISGGLERYNDEITEYNGRQPLAVVVQDPASGEILGGATGRTSLGLLFLELFYLPQSLRGNGLGTQILQRFEEEGRKRGCRSAVLYTISFQAPAFYERHGWRIFGEIPCDPPGTSRVFLTKAL